MTYPSSRHATATACDHHARACCMAVNTARSSDFGRKRRTLRLASCMPNDRDTSARNCARSFLESARILACTIARSKINSGDGSGNSGTLRDSDTPPSRASILNEIANEYGESSASPAHLITTSDRHDRRGVAG